MAKSNADAPPPQSVRKAAKVNHAANAAHDASPPAWVNKFVWTALWKVVAVGVIVALGVAIVLQLVHLLSLLLISLFFALAIIPGVEALTRRFNMPRGAAVGIIFLAALTVVVLLVAVLIPAIVEFASTVSRNFSTWIATLDGWSKDYLGGEVIDQEVAEQAAAPVLRAVQEWGDNVLGIVGSGLGLVFDLFTIMTFTFYFAADFPRLMRAIMRRMPPERQAVATWVARTSIEQTGGYFYSRLLLMLVCGSGAFLVMMILGLPLVYALPMALFMGFVSEFIPFVGTYIGAAIPILVMLAVQGVVPAVVLLGYVLVYQQVENYVLNPRLSSKTMELNGAVAFGGAIAGGAIAGPMGAFMALPVAALITSIAKNTGRTYEVLEDSDGDGLSEHETTPREAAEN
ncbi:AI-2E family transporter [Demequina sp.]|uniref:AI-2E family transporter n=1 Tax=Demequina sp. TaxID=2050685 RepID=UPI003A83A42A